MSDIVERLRDPHAACSWTVIARRAADEIERLRLEKQRLGSALIAILQNDQQSAHGISREALESEAWR